MKASKITMVLLDVFIRTPIWFYLMYSILKAINVDRLVWFLFWIYVPVAIVTTIIGIIVAKTEK